MAASFSLEDFVGDGVLKDILGKLEADGWDDVPTLKMMNATDMEALHLTDEQRNSLEIRTYLHDRNLIQYGDKLESHNKPLPELLNTSPLVLASEYGMRRGHVARFLDRSSACGVQLPPNLALPARKRGGGGAGATTPRDSEYSFSTYQSGGGAGAPPVSPSPSVQSNDGSLHHRGRMNSPHGSAGGGFGDFNKQSGASEGGGGGGDVKKGGRYNEEKKGGGGKMGMEIVPIKGRMGTTHIEPKLCGLVPPPKVADDVTPLSVLEKIYIHKLTPEFKTGTDPWGGGELDLPPPMKAYELWTSKATLLLCVRRPGCVMCRAEAHQLYARKAVFAAMGIQLVAVLNEYIDAEVRAFWPKYWGGTVVLDRNRDLFKALGGGTLMKENLITGFIFNSQARRNWRRATSTGFVYNLRGEGTIKGGLYVVGPGKTGVAYQFVERTFGDWAPLEEVMDVCTKLQ